MTPISLGDLTQNAYRTLGLLAGATQAEVDSAARSLRLWDDASQIPPTANDAAFLGPVRRSRRDIESAVSRLAEPESRVQERLWWFCTMPPKSDAPAGVAPGPAARHDAGLVGLYRALLIEADNSSLPRWKSLIEWFEHLARDDDYLAWLLEAESDGDFEKRASPEEIAAAQHDMPARLGLALAAAVGADANDNHPAAAGQVLRLLKSAQRGEAPASGDANRSSDPATKILDGLEDRLSQACDQNREQIQAAWKSGQINILRPVCHRVVNQFDADIQPLVHELATAGNEDRRERARQQAAGLLSYAADGYEACYDFVSSDRALQKAMHYALNTVLEPGLRVRMVTTAAAAGRQRLGAPPKQRENSSYTPGSIPSGRKPASNSGGGKKSGVFLLLFVGMMVLRAIISMNGSNSSGDGSDVPRHPYYYPSGGGMSSDRELQQAFKSLNDYDQKLRDESKNQWPNLAPTTAPFLVSPEPDASVPLAPPKLSLQPNFDDGTPPTKDLSDLTVPPPGGAVR